MSQSGLYWNLCVRSGTTASTLKGEIWNPAGSKVSSVLLRPCHWGFVNGVGPLVKSASDSREHDPRLLSAQPADGAEFMAGAYVTFSIAAARGFDASNET